jgi:stage V sporulation protein B
VLRILALGMGAFALLGISSTALTSLGRERASATLTAVAVMLVGTGCFLVAPSAAFGSEMLLRTAISTSVAMTLCAAAGAFILHREAGGFVSPLSFIRVLAAMTVTVIVGAQMPWISKPAVLIQGVVMAALYIVVLLVTGELGKQDLGQVKKVLGKA